jgi:ubiquinone/menaquinone biosynthesis C-methylase UbiE
MSTTRTDDEQAALWNGKAGCAWVESQELLDQTFKPFEDLLVDAVAARSSGRVLDVGCGTGSTTLAVARSSGRPCTGIDISAPMIAAARTRAERESMPVTFIQDDAQTHAFEPASFDSIVSRFGVMFFEDSVRAFANLRHAASSGAQLLLIVWRSAEENPFMTTAERAAAPLLPDMPARKANEPGQFAFADKNRVARILQESGWTDIDIQPVDIVCRFPESALVRYLTRLGPLGRIFDQLEEKLREQVVATVRRAFDPYVHGTEVRFVAACWVVRSRASTDSRDSRNA